MGIRLKPYGGFACAKRKDDDSLDCYAFLISAKSREDAMKKELIVAMYKFPEDEYYNIVMDAIGPE